MTVKEWERERLAVRLFWVGILMMLIPALVAFLVAIVETWWHFGVWGFVVAAWIFVAGLISFAGIVVGSTR